MASASRPTSVRVLPNNKVYRQLFDAQVQLTETYQRVRDKQLSKPVEIVTHPDATPLVRNIRPHESQKRQWLTALPNTNEKNLNPVALVFHDEKLRRLTREQQEIEQIKKEVYNLPDDLKRDDDDDFTDNAGSSKENVTERIAAAREVKFNQLWSEFMIKIADFNYELVTKLEVITAECNSFYEQGTSEIESLTYKMIYSKEITSLNKNSFEKVFEELDALLPPRLSSIQNYCQSMELLEMERIDQFRRLFKMYSDRFYKIHHLTDEEVANQLENVSSDINAQTIENRKIYTELEARLLSGETDRVHQARCQIVDHQTKWRQSMWIIAKQTWISKLSLCRAKFESILTNHCDALVTDINEERRHFLEHVQLLNTFIPPTSTKENAENWHDEAYKIVSNIETQRELLLTKIRSIINSEIELLQKESLIIQEKILQGQVYDEKQLGVALKRDILPLLDERKQFLEEMIYCENERIYKKFTQSMYEVIERLTEFIRPPGEFWDDHQIRLEQVTAQLVDMMRECRHPHDVQNEKKLTKLDSTLDEMRSASNEANLARLLASAYEQLDSIKSSYSQFYEMEHSIVNRYSSMIAEEVARYKTQVLDYFHVQEVETKEEQEDPVENLPLNHQIYTSILDRLVYIVEDPHVGGEAELNDSLFNENLLSPERPLSDNRTRLCSSSMDEEQNQKATFLTEPEQPSEEKSNVFFSKSFQIPSNTVYLIIFNLTRSYLDYCDNWKQETTQRAEAVMFSKHDELDKEMDFQMHLHEPRRIRIETDIHNVRAAELVMHDERVERHIHGVKETLEQTDTDYRRMLSEFSKSIVTYKEEVFALENVFVNATTSGRLLALQNRLTKKRDQFMENIRVSLRGFRKRFDDSMQYLRQANIKFRKSFKMFSEGGNFSREEIENYRKRLEKTAMSIDKAETSILKEMEKLEKKQLEDATKVMNQFQERFKNHLSDLQFIEVTNRWISDTQVKIKSEVALSNEQAKVMKNLVETYSNQLDSLINPNLDKKSTNLQEVRQSFQQIVEHSYERALYLKCLQNELHIPPSLINKLKSKGLINELDLISDLGSVSGADELNSARRASKLSHATASGAVQDEIKSVKFASTGVLSPTKLVPSALGSMISGVNEEVNTIATIRTLLQYIPYTDYSINKNEQVDSDEIVEPGIPSGLVGHTRSIASASSTRSSQTKRSSKKPGSSTSEASSTAKRDRPIRARTRDEIFALYCTFGEHPSTCQDFLAKISNILRESTEGLLSHGEVFYREKGSRPVTRPQALCEKFDQYAHTMIEKLRKYEDQCRSYHENSVNEFRGELESVERTSCLLAKLELDDQLKEAEKSLHDIKEKYLKSIDEASKQTDQHRTIHLDQLRPTLGHPGRKTDLEILNQQEKERQDQFQENIDLLKNATIEELHINGQQTMQIFANNAERLLILFDDLLTVDEVIRMKIPPAKKVLSELVRRQQSGQPLEDPEPMPLIERKQGHWTGLTLFDEMNFRRRDASTNRKRSTSSTQRPKVSASIVTQKTTLPQVETVKKRDHIYQKYKKMLLAAFNEIEKRSSESSADNERHQTHWSSSIEKLQQLRN